MMNLVMATFGLPIMYFGCVPAVLLQGVREWPILVVLSGVAALVVGLLLGYRDPKVGWSAATLVLPHAFSIASAIWGGQIADPSIILWSYIALQVGVVVAVPIMMRQARVAGILLGWFGATYGLFAAFIGGMMLTGTYI